MKKKTLRNNEPEKMTDAERISELELLLLEQSFQIDELEEEIELLKEAPKIIIKEIHHWHPQYNYYPPVQIQPWPPINPGYPIVLCESGNNKYLC